MHGQHSVYGVSFDFFNPKSHDIYIKLGLFKSDKNLIPTIHLN